MKKFLVLASVLVLSFFLVACLSGEASVNDEGTSEEAKAEESSNGPIELIPEEEASLKVWASQGPEGEFMKMVGEKFKDEYGVEVVYEEVDFTESVTRLLQDGQAEVWADAFAMPHDRLEEAYSAGIVYPNGFISNSTNTHYHLCL